MLRSRIACSAFSVEPGVCSYAYNAATWAYAPCPLFEVGLSQGKKDDDRLTRNCFAGEKKGYYHSLPFDLALTSHL